MIPTTPEPPLPNDVAVCTGCSGRIFKISRGFYECKFCGCRKPKRNPVRPQVCRKCVITYCRHIPEGRTTCRKLVKPTKPPSKTRLATAGNGLYHTCGECRFMPTIPDIIAAWHGKKTHACIGKKVLSGACNKFIAGPSSLPSLIQVAALAQCNPSEGERYMKRNKPISLLIVPTETAAWMTEAVKRIRERNGTNFGLTTLARAVMNAACKANLNLDSCRNEFDILDLLRKRLTATEVK